MCWRQRQCYFSTGARTGEECLSDWLIWKMCWGACCCTPQKLGHRPCGCRSGRQGVVCWELKQCLSSLHGCQFRGEGSVSRWLLLACQEGGNFIRRLECWWDLWVHCCCQWLWQGGLGWSPKGKTGWVKGCGRFVVTAFGHGRTVC